ncbi:MAG: acyltransferase [Ruminococcaceae bacterium]|nr:acyltransferase [Oscillospiraceae bacterium]
MIIYLIVLAAICLYGIRCKGKNGFEDYMSPQKTGSIKGIFVVIVLYSHIRQYIAYDPSPFNAPFQKFLWEVGQLMVVAFLFYSGYGVALGLKNKDGYAKTLPKSRILKVFIHFDIAVLLFWVTGLILGKNYPVKRVLLSLIGMDALGNSVWFIFDIIILYFITFVVFAVAKKHMIAGTAVLTLLTVGATAGIYLWKGEQNWWYDTIMCFPLGMWYALAKPRIDKALLHHPVKWAITTAITLAAFLALHHFSDGGYRIIFIIESLVFALLVSFISMRLSINNGILQWFGKRVFGIYILQRIPMMILYHYGAQKNPFLFAAVSFAATIVMAEIFERATDKLDNALGLNKKRKNK